MHTPSIPAPPSMGRDRHKGRLPPARAEWDCGLPGRTHSVGGLIGLMLLIWVLSACGNSARDRASAIEGANPSPTAETSPRDASAADGSATPAPADAPPEVHVPSSVGNLGMVLASSLHVRSGAGMHNASVGVLRCGDVVKIEEQQGEWYRVKVEEVQGWSHMAWLNPIRAGGHMPRCGRPEYGGVLPKVPSTPGFSRLPDPAKDEKAEELQADKTPSERKAVEPAPSKPDSVKEEPVKSGPVTSAPAKTEPVKSELVKSEPVKAEPVVSQTKGPKSLELSVSASRPGKVTFPHFEHNKQFECAQCHHPVEGKVRQEAKTDKTCRTCHLRVEGEGLSPVKAKDAFHKTCRDCHQTSGAGPTKCVECHQP